MKKEKSPQRRLKEIKELKKTALVVLTFLLGINTLTFPNKVCVINGHSDLKKQEYESLEINGDIIFENLTINNALDVNGRIHGKHLTCKTMASNGSVDVENLQAQTIESNGSFSGKNIKITGESKFNGEVEITNGTIKSIEVSGEQLTLSNTAVHGTIHIKKVTKGGTVSDFQFKKSSTQILELKGTSVVTGDVIFEQEGEVHLFNGAKIHGKTIRAKVIRK
jgi:hypothetical protein